MYFSLPVDDWRSIERRPSSLAKDRRSMRARACVFIRLATEVRQLETDDHPGLRRIRL